MHKRIVFLHKLPKKVCLIIKLARAWSTKSPCYSDKPILLKQISYIFVNRKGYNICKELVSQSSDYVEKW